MIYLITGANGGGKSLRSIYLMREIVKQNQRKDVLEWDEYKQQFDDDMDPIVDDVKPLRRDIVTNIKGVNFDDDNIYTFQADKSKPNTFDWRTYRPGTVFFIDEAHQVYPGTGKSGPSPFDVVNELDEHRHQGYDLYFITQFPTKISHIIRNLVTNHYHLQNISGSQNASLFTWQYACPSPNDFNERKGADKSIFRYDKSLFKHYKSSSIHTRKLRIPKQFYVLFLIFGGGGFYFFHSLSNSGGSFISAVNTQDKTVSDAGNSAQAPSGGTVVNVAETTTLSGCIATAHHCRCYDHDGNPMKQDFSQCQLLMTKPLPYSMNPNFKEGKPYKPSKQVSNDNYNGLVGTTISLVTYQPHHGQIDYFK